MTNTVQINLRVEDEIAQVLEQIADKEALRRTDLNRKYMVEGIRRWKLENAIARYQKGEISMARAAEEAGILLYEMMEQLRRRSISQDQTTPDEARAAIQDLLARLG